MSDRYKGAILSPTAPTVTPQSAGGIYTSSQQLQYQGQGVWPTAFNNPINNSLRFRSSASAYLNRTPASAGNRQTWTWSGWVKLGLLSPSSGWNAIFGAYSDDNNRTFFYTNNNSVSNTFYIFDIASGSTTCTLISTQVLRDVSAWYHLIVSVDTTQATSSNRIKVYLNGSQITSFGTASYPSQNTNFMVNNNVVHYIGASSFSGINLFHDGYLAEVNFVDGLALTPSSFGTTDAYGIWQPIPYTGTYGTNGFYLPFRPGTTSSYAGVLSSGNYLSAASNAAFSMSTGAFTMETWFLPTNSSQSGQFFNVASGGIQMGYQNSSTWGLAQANVAWQLTTNTLPITNVWNHMAIVRSGTGTNQTALFLNGVRVAQGTISTNYSQNSIDIGNGIIGYMSNSRVVKGTAVYDPAQSTYTVPTAPLTNISGTSLLTFQNTSAIDNSSNAFSLTTTGTITYPLVYPFDLNIASDESGNGNNWTTNNISLTPGSTYDSMVDVPTNTNSNTANYCVLNPLQLATPVLSYSLSNGNLQLNSNSGSTYNCFANGTIFPTTGKWYAEFQQTGGTRVFAGISRFTNIAAPNSWNSSSTYYINTGEIQKDGSTVVTGATWTTGDIIGVAYDADAATCAFYKNNVLQTTVTGVTAGTYSFSVNGYQSGVIVANFGQQPFTYTPPTGFNRLNTYNLPTPTILAGNQYFNAVTRNGFGSSGGSVTSLNFQPDFWWEKARNTVSNNTLIDSIRGVTKELYSNLTNAESTGSNFLVSFNSNGFTMGSNDWGTSTTLVDWVWRAGGTPGVSNTQGTITSTVSANTTAGFSIVTYTGTGVTGTIGHGLGVAPAMIIVKSRSNASNWYTYHQSIGNTGAVALNLTNATITSANFWNNTSPTSSVFTASAGSAEINGNGLTYVAYCFTAVSGYSAFGSYTGNGSTDGPFVYTGFRPRFILCKRTDSSTGGNWTLIDSARNSYNVTNLRLYSDTSDAESSSANVYDLLSNGFKLRQPDGSTNNISGATYIYMAFAENPFKIARGR